MRSRPTRRREERRCPWRRDRRPTEYALRDQRRRQRATSRNLLYARRRGGPPPRRHDLPPAVVTVTIPLARLLAMAYRQLIDDLHDRLAAAGHSDVRPEFGYVLLAVREQPTTGADIALLLGVTKQAASKLIDEMERGGYVKRQAHGDDGRAKAIAITARGKTFLALVESIYDDL